MNQSDTAGVAFMQIRWCNAICGVHFGMNLHPLYCTQETLFNANAALQKNVNGLNKVLENKSVLFYLL